MSTYETVTIPGAFYDLAFERGLEVPLDEEFRRVGKGKQYTVRKDELFDNLVAEADKFLTEEHHGTKLHYAAVAFLRSLRKSGVKFNITNELPAQSRRRITWVKTGAVLGPGFGKYSGRNLVGGIDESNGNVIIRVHGTQQTQVFNIASAFAQQTQAQARRIADQKKAAKRAAKAARRSR